ncbi:MAG: DUF3748 domain-containing protein, partial [Bacteroidota bacterium]
MKRIRQGVFLLSVAMTWLTGCRFGGPDHLRVAVPVNEKQVTFSAKNHALDNNDNFSPDGRFLCYDTRGTVFADNLANCKSIGKVEIATGKETVLWEPPSITGENAAPGVAAASFHPSGNRVIFIHGPNPDEVKVRGYYGIRNRTAVEVDGAGNGNPVNVDMRDVESKITTPGAHRGGTHRHEYSRNGDRIGFTYDDYLVQEIDRTIGFLQPHPDTPGGYTHYFAVILKPAEKGKSKAGEIEKAYGDSWVDSSGTMRAFIGKVRAQNGVGYEHDLFVADIPEDIDITSASPGTREQYPEPPEEITIRRLTQGMNVTGIVRGSHDGTKIAFAAGEEGMQQLYITQADGTEKEPARVTNLNAAVSSIRWHPSGNWIFFISAEELYMARVKSGTGFGKTTRLSDGMLEREQLAVSPDGTRLA